MDKVKQKYYFEKAANLAGVIFFGFFAYNFLIDFIVSHRLSSLLILVMESIVIYFFLTRDIPKQTSMKFYDWFIALACTYLPLLLRAGPNIYDLSFLLYLQLIGTVVSTIAILSLNSSFGIVAANRGVKKGDCINMYLTRFIPDILPPTPDLFFKICVFGTVLYFFLHLLFLFCVFSPKKNFFQKTRLMPIT